MSVLKFFWSMIMMGLHELCHVVMAILLYPFGIRLTGYNVEVSADFKCFKSMYVFTNSKNRLCTMLISAAPIIFYVVGMLWLLFSNHYVIYGVMAVFGQRHFHLSSGDRKNFIDAMLNRKAHLQVSASKF